MDAEVSVNENAGHVLLHLVATGAEIGTNFTVMVDPRETIPPSATGTGLSH